MAKLTPMMQQYMDLKQKYNDCILFYRLGDFYEMFFEDAIKVSKELEITLTGRQCGMEEKAPMCGVPHHASEGYIDRLIKKGYKVAICEQVEDANVAKGIVKRDVVRIVTPGTNVNPQSLEEDKNNYILCICEQNLLYGISVADITTGDFFTTQVTDSKNVLDEVMKFSPSEIIFYGKDNEIISDIKDRLVLTINELEDWYVDKYSCEDKIKTHFGVKVLEGLGLGDMPQGVIASGALLQYLYETQKNSLSHLTNIIPYQTAEFMMLDSSTRRNLELVETLREKERKGSLIWVLDKTKTAMGARLLRTWIEQPLVSKEAITHRLETVNELKDSPMVREELRELLHPVYDLERLMGRISYGTANPRDLIAFKKSLEMLPHIKNVLDSTNTPLAKKLFNQLDELQDVCQLIDRSIIDEPPVSTKDGNVIKENFNEEVDTLRKATTEGKQWLAELESKEKQATGIKSLKIKFNKVFGYYIEVTKSYLDMVPDNYIRKQTMTNAERYITEELKVMEETILGAQDKVIVLEHNLFNEIRENIGKEVKRIKQTAKIIATIDVLSSLAFVAERNGYTKPELNTEGYLDIKDGRHPVVEKMIDSDLFIANDTKLDEEDNRVAIITGPNMAGKSTYMRQVAQIVLMAQIGSFVPASSANISIVDRIFTRVGASDDLASGQSTFMVEMTEVANILRNATKNSLLILDEIGRGTSTFDGLSIAWSVVEYISDNEKIGAKTLFATHYHELTELEGKIDGVNNYCIAVKENGDDIIFLRKIIKGGADNSYGIQVAKLAGVPDDVIERAKELVDELSEADITKHVDVTEMLDKKSLKEDTQNSIEESTKQVKKEDDIMLQLNLFDSQDDNEVIKELESMNVIEMTPMEAMNKLFELQKMVNKK